MSTINWEIVKILKKKGSRLLKEPAKKIEFVPDQNANQLLNNLEEFPHVFVLACIMDRQIKAERAWIIPYKIGVEIGSFKLSEFLKLSSNQISEIYRKGKLHRFNEVMAKNFFLGINWINTKYNNDASKIWTGTPGSATIVRRFMEFPGIGIKIATMATNILARDFKVSMKDYLCIDISPDVQVKRVFNRLGFISDSASDDELLYAARELNPLYPGIFDFSCWEIGRNWCRPNDPKCEDCYLSKDCPTNQNL